MSMVPVNVQKELSDRSNDLTEQGPITRLELRHFQDGDPAGDLIQRFLFGDDGAGNLALEDYQQMIWDKAEQDAKSRTDGVTQRYVMFFYRGPPDHEDYDSRFPFVIRTRGVSLSRMGDDSTPPNETGLTAQALRHDADMHRMLMLMSGSHAERSEATIERQERQIENLTSRQHRLMLLQEDLLDRKTDRDIRAARETQRAKRHDQVAEMVLAVVPIMLAQVAGGKAIAGVDIASKLRDQSIGRMLKSMSPEQLVQAMNAFPADMRLAFLELYKSYRNDSAAADAGKPEVFRDQPAAEQGGAAH